MPPVGKAGAQFHWDPSSALWTQLPLPVLIPLWDFQPAPWTHALRLSFALSLTTFNCIIIKFGEVCISRFYNFFFLQGIALKLSHSDPMRDGMWLIDSASCYSRRSSTFLLRFPVPRLLPVISRHLVMSKMPMEAFVPWQTVLEIWPCPKRLCLKNVPGFK